jgi:hypothetical protein
MPPGTSNRREYQPERLSRKSEIMAWSLAVLILATLFVAQDSQPALARSGRIVLVIVSIVASGITFSNWTDRATTLLLDESGVAYRNGLRRVKFDWAEIRTVKILPALLGASRVQVIGDDRYFEFKTLGTVEYQGEVRGRSGFRDGDKILKAIIEKAGLQENGTEENGSTYYSSGS